MKTTANYGFKKPEKNEYINIDDLNDNMDAIDKEIISSAIALDMDEIGRYSVNALDEYLSLGHSNNYYSVNQHVITKENTKDYRTEDEK